MENEVWSPEEVGMDAERPKKQDVNKTGKCELQSPMLFLCDCLGCTPRHLCCTHTACQTLGSGFYIHDLTLSSMHSCEVGTTMSLILMVRIAKLREAILLTQGHIASKGQNPNSNSGTPSLKLHTIHRYVDTVEIRQLIPGKEDCLHSADNIT